MTLATTAREARSSAKAELSRLLVRLLAELDITQDELARACGVGPSIVQRWGDRDRHESPSVADVLAMPRPLALGLLRWMADAHDQVLADAPSESSLSDDLEHLAATIHECGEASSVFARAIADGQISAAEARAIDRETTQAIGNLATMRERARALLSPTPRLYRTGEE